MEKQKEEFLQNAEAKVYGLAGIVIINNLNRRQTKMVTKAQMKAGWTNILVEESTKKMLIELKLRWGLLTYNQLIRKLCTEKRLKYE